MRRGTIVHLWIVVACAGLSLAACSDDAKKPAGDPCEHNTDCEDEICHVGVCASKSPDKVGAACTLDAKCRSFNCAGGVCASGTRSIGAPCRFNIECASENCEIEGSLPGLCVKDANPDGAVPDAAADAGVDQAPPDAVLSDKALPDKALPDTALPDQMLPDTMPPDFGPCGNKNEPCCGGLCNGTLACVGGTCVCGGKDQPCCSGSVCDANLTCLSSSTNLCACGALQQACCNGTTCSGSLFCTGKACACIKVLDTIFFVRTDGTIWYSSYTSVNKAIGGLSSMTEVAAGGSYHACGLKSDGTVWCWSRHSVYGNMFGQLANGTFVTPSTSDIPSQVKVTSSSYLTGVTNIGGTGSYGPGFNQTACAVKSDKTVWCWGRAQDGLFQGTTNTNKAFATQIKASATTMLTGATQVGVNYRHACAVVGSGLACWGQNALGQLGAGDSTARQYPVLVTIAGKTVKRVSVGVDFSCALTTTGEVYCWGLNSTGQCGQGYPSAALASPTQVAQSGGGKLTGVKEIAAGSEMACAVKTNGSLWCWGKWPTSNHSATQMKDKNGVLINDAILVTTIHHNYRILRTDGEYHIGGTGSSTYSCP